MKRDMEIETIQDDLVQHRNTLITLEYYKGGKKLRELSEEHCLTKGRIHQIIRSTLMRLGLPLNATPEEVGLAVMRRADRRVIAYHQTPEHFYWRLKAEREHEARRAIYHGEGAIPIEDDEEE